ncbi:unnamed protein product, partial [Prorocentrum cordatum]
MAAAEPEARYGRPCSVAGGPALAKTSRAGRGSGGEHCGFGDAAGGGALWLAELGGCRALRGGRCLSARGHRDRAGLACVSRGSTELEELLGDLRRAGSPEGLPSLPSPRPASVCGGRRPPPLLANSLLSARANTRAEELDRILEGPGRGDSRAAEGRGSPGSAGSVRGPPGPGAPFDSAARFQNLELDIDAALLGQVARLAPGDDAAGELWAGQQRLFLVPMPAHPAEVVLTLAREEGGPLSMFASLRPWPRPTPKIHDLEADLDGRGGARLVHVHGGGESSGGERPESLHVCVAAGGDAARSTFRLQCAFTRAQRRTSSAAGDEHGPQGRIALGSGAGAEQRWLQDVMARLRQDPAERERLESRVRALKEKRRLLQRSLTRPAENASLVATTWSPQARAEKSQVAAQREAERRAAAARRREEAEAELERQR